MRFHFRDLMGAIEPAVQLMPGPPVPGCGCTQTAPAPPCPFPSVAEGPWEAAGPAPECKGCTATGPMPACTYPSFTDLVTDRAGRLSARMLETLRDQLQSELRAQG